jgi:hypothetical protein
VTPPTCGLVLTPQRLVAVVLRPGGEARRLVRAALTDDARYGLVEYLSATGAEIVATDALARADPVARRAARARPRRLGGSRRPRGGNHPGRRAHRSGSRRDRTCSDARDLASILQRKRLSAPNLADLDGLEERLLAFISEWNEIAHPFAWTAQSFDKILAKTDTAIAAAA